MLAMAPPRRLGRGVMLVSGHAGDHDAESTWSRHDVGADNHANVTPGLICT
jgi:hypothetical protein